MNFKKIEKICEELRVSVTRPLLRELSYEIIQFAIFVWELEKEFRWLKLDYDDKLNTRTIQLSELYALNKSKAKAEIELKEVKNNARQSEARYNKWKLLFQAYQAYLVTLRKEIEQIEDHEKFVNSVAKEEREMRWVSVK